MNASPWRQADVETATSGGDLCVIIKPTARCNGGCLYCSSHKAKQPADMPPELLDEIYGQLFAYAQNRNSRYIAILWHGGEPLLMGKDFFRKALAQLPGQKNLKIKHLLQSNLLCLDAEWLALLKQHNVSLSTSADPFGQARVYSDGRPQFPDWMEKFILAADAGLNLGVVFTVTCEHLEMVENIFLFFKNLQSLSARKIGVKINPVYPSGKASGEGANHTISPVEYGRFLMELKSLWEENGRTYPISPFTEWFQTGRLMCESSGNCNEHFISIDGEGMLYHCGRFLDKGLALGNISGGLKTAFEDHSWRKRLSHRTGILLSGKCGKCEHWVYCRGGCPYFADLYEGDALRASPFCLTTKMLMESSSRNDQDTYLCGQVDDLF
jgi:uncharacterized protein